MTPLAAQGAALGLGTLGGIAAYNIGVPLPWMLGPMLANTLAVLLRAPLAAPSRLRPLVIPVIGVMLGSAVTAEIFGQVARWSLSLLLLPLLLVFAAGTSFLIYRRLGGYDRVTAYFAALPGGLNEMLILGEEAGGDARRIALAHAARILFTILFVGSFFGLVLGVRSTGQGASWIGLAALTPADYAVLAACAVAGAWLGKRLGLPAAPVLGPMILSAAAHITEIVTVAPPTLLVIAAQITIGTIIGTRFAGTTLRELRRDLRLAALATVAMLAIAWALAFAAAKLSAVPLEQAFLAYAPGGLTEMTLLTLALGQDVAYVAVLHIARITLVVGLAPLAFTRLRARVARGRGAD